MTTRFRLAFLASAWAMAVTPLPSQTSPWALTFNVDPYVVTPIDKASDNTTSLFPYGLGTKVSVDYTPARLPLVSLGLVGDYAKLTTPDPSLAVYLAGGGLQLGLNLKVLPALSVIATGSGGVFTAGVAPTAFSGLGGWISAGAGLGLNIGDFFSLHFAANYQDNFESLSRSLYSGASYSLSAHFMPAGNAPFILDTTVPAGFAAIQREKKGVKLVGLKTDRIFPVFKNYYDASPVAQVILHNYDPSDAQNVSVSALVKDYMNGPRDLTVPATIPAGGDAKIDVYTLLNDRVLTIAETTKLTLGFTVKYRQNGQEYTESYDPTIESLYRNAITWDDDQHVAAFISARDPAAYGFVRALVAATRDQRNHALSTNLQTAMVVHEALKQHGLIYSKVPSSPFNTGDKVTVDTVQFPQETLVSKTGDCSDLTVLWCSLLESVGIETAAVTTPGHIYMAFALEISPEQAVALLGSRDQFLLRGGKAWVPVETTLISDSFMNAWKEGARESDPLVQPSLGFYPIHDAWKIYAPVVVSGTAAPPAIPSDAKLTQSLAAELDSLYRSELEPRAAKLRADLAAGGANAAKTTSSLALLYARYGEYEQAAQLLTELTAKQSYGPAFVNLGNILLLQKKYPEALARFDSWLTINPDEALAVAGEALAYDGMGDRANSQAAFTRLSSLDKRLAAKYTYLGAAASDGGGRAAEAGQLESVVEWKE
ncbi:MAG: hypothetical protein WCG80_06885 [Spirochaetales bacterium]